jgi:hypothetical protein
MIPTDPGSAGSGGDPQSWAASPIPVPAHSTPFVVHAGMNGNGRRRSALAVMLML